MSNACSSTDIDQFDLLNLICVGGWVLVWYINVRLTQSIWVEVWPEAELEIKYRKPKPRMDPVSHFGPILDFDVDTALQVVSKCPSCCKAGISYWSFLMASQWENCPYSIILIRRNVCKFDLKFLVLYILLM